MLRRCRLLPVVVLPVLLLALPGAVGAAAPPGPAAVQRGLDGLVAASGGPPGAIATLYRGGRLTVLRAGRADVARKRPPRATDHMRIASIAKAFSGAVALQLVRDGRLGLDDTIGQRRPDLPAAWAGVTVRQLLNHTSGLPDYTRSAGFREQVENDPRGFVTPLGVIEWVRADGLVFPSGSDYEYSNTDNIVVGLIAETVTGRSYRRLLTETVFSPAGLGETSFPTRRLTLPAPFIHGYLVAPGEEDQDVTSFLSPSGAWASGGSKARCALSTCPLVAFKNGWRRIPPPQNRTPLDADSRIASSAVAPLRLSTR